MGILQLTSRKIGCSDIAWGNGAFSWVDENGISHTASEVNASQIPLTTGETVDSIRTSLAGWTKLADGDSLPDAVTALGVSCGVLYLSSGTYPVAANLTIPTNVKLIVEKCALITIADGITLTLNGPFEAGLYRVFSCAGAGKVAFGSASVRQVYPEWWAANTTPGTTDMAPAINAALVTGKEVFLPGDLYAVNSCINATNRRGACLKGTGREMYSGSVSYGTAIIGNSGAGKAMLDVSGSVGAQVQGINLYQGTSTIGIITGYTSVDGCNRQLIRDVTIYMTSDVTANDGLGTVGLVNMGAENSTYEHLEIYADNPVIMSRVTATNWIAAGSTYSIASDYATLQAHSCQNHTFVGDISLVCLDNDRFALALYDANGTNLGGAYLAGTDSANVAAILIQSGTNFIWSGGVAENFKTLLKIKGAFLGMEIDAYFGTPIADANPIIDFTAGTGNSCLVNADITVSLPTGAVARCFMTSSDSPQNAFSDNVRLACDQLVIGDIATIQPPATLLAKCRGLKVCVLGGIWTPVIDWTTSAAVTGFSALTTNNVWYREVEGRVLHVIYQFTGTSDATTLTFALPYTVSSEVRAFAQAEDDSAWLANPGLLKASALTATLYKDGSEAAFKASGEKSAWGEFHYFY